MKKLVLLLTVLLMFSCEGKAQKDTDSYPIEKTEKQWRQKLGEDQFLVLRKKVTEPAFSSPLNNITEPGTFVCAACGNPLYKTENKFNSGTGWPSFDRPIDEDNVTYNQDRIGGFPAKEVVCSQCGGHLGHVFNDGPTETTGKRHCINGAALVFKPQ